MIDSGELDPRTSRIETSPDAPFNWSRLLGVETPADALEELARWLGPGTRELLLETEGNERIADWRSAEPASGPGVRRQALVRGVPTWRLRATGSEGSLTERSVARAAMALEGWREAQLELGRAESRLAARTRELHLIQALGRRAASARTPFDLFSSVVSVLGQGEDLDFALVVHAIDGSEEVLAYLARPVADRCLLEVARQSLKFLGWPPGVSFSPQRIELDSYDPAQGPRQRASEEDVVLLPILRGDNPVACLILVPARRASEGPLRLFYSAANQLALHLDRILTVREAEADRFRSILDSMPQAVLLTDRELRIVQANRSAIRLLDASGLSPFGTFRDAVAKLGLRDLVERVRGGSAAVAEGEVSPDGEHVLAVTVSPLAVQPGENGGLVVVLNDVTEARRMQQSLAQSEKMSSLGQMISGVAHELNNPLTSIMGYAQLLVTATDEGVWVQRARTLEREAERCRKIVQNLLSFARRRETERKALSLNEVVQSVLGLMGYQLRVAGIEVATDLSPELPAARGDAHQLQQVLVNLLNNAQQAIAATGEKGTIRLRTVATDDGGILLEVRDSGPGIPDEVRGKIFDPFFTTKSEGQGTGLGLSLVYGIVRDHGGSIEALPSREGAVFQVRLPGGQSREVEKPAAPAPEQHVGAPGRILVVEDEAALAEMICDVLAEEGHRAESVRDGAQALDRLSEEFDLIISDLKMPGMGGERLHREIRRRRPDLAQKLLLTTGDTIGSDPERIAARTGLDVLLKPFDAAHLRRAVRAKLGGGKRT